MESVEVKNPISLLHEYCQLRQTAPLFKTINEEGEPHAKMFTVSCTVYDKVTTGKGRSLKQARTNCAHDMVEKLKNEGILNADFLEGKDKSNPFSKLSNDCLKTKIHDNPVGCLQEYCISAKIPMPDYSDAMTNDGFKTTCKVNDITCEGSGRQKKLAKAEAARKVCEQLFRQLNNESETSVNGTDEDKEDKEAEEGTDKDKEDKEAEEGTDKDKEDKEAEEGTDEDKEAEETTKQSDESEDRSLEVKTEVNNNSGEVNGVN